MRRVDLPPESLPDSSREGRPLTLPDDPAHYVRDVLRMEPGDELELFDGTGRLLKGRLQKVSERDVVCWIERDAMSQRGESPCEIALVQAIPKGERWKWVLQKATELGVSHVVPVESERTVVDIPDDRLDAKMERWHRIVRSAARQCGRTVTPTIASPRAFRALRDEADGGVLEDVPWLVPHPSGERGLSEVLESAPPISEGDEPRCALGIGPEGGWSPREIEALRDRDATIVDLGPRILRTETAALTAVALTQHVLGDLRGPADAT